MSSIWQLLLLVQCWANKSSTALWTGQKELKSCVCRYKLPLELFQSGFRIKTPCVIRSREGNLSRDTVPVRGRARHTSRQNDDMNLRCNSEKKRLEEDNGLISQKLTVRPAWTVNNLIITDLMPLGLTEIEKATLGWGAVNQLCAPPAHAEAATDDRYKFKWQLKGTLRHTHIWLTSPTKWFKNVTFF